MSSDQRKPPAEAPRKRRYRLVKAKPGELRVAYGKAEWYDNVPEIVFAWGDGCLSGHTYPVMDAFCGRMEERSGPNGRPSMVQELERMGYDLTTLRFTIQKKEKPDGQ